jgi:hypothetical protein
MSGCALTCDQDADKVCVVKTKCTWANLNPCDQPCQAMSTECRQVCGSGKQWTFPKPTPKPRAPQAPAEALFVPDPKPNPYLSGCALKCDTEAYKVCVVKRRCTLTNLPLCDRVCQSLSSTCQTTCNANQPWTYPKTGEVTRRFTATSPAAKKAAGALQPPK